jgi:hypothetical protein
MLMIGTGGSDPGDSDEAVQWHHNHQAWLSNEEHDLPVGTPVIARMGGPSNGLLIDCNEFADELCDKIPALHRRGES